MNTESKMTSLKDKIIAKENEDRKKLEETASEESTSEEGETEEAKPVHKGRGKGRKNKKSK